MRKILLLYFVLFTGELFAQSSNGEVSGIVKDSTNTVIGATITLFHIATKDSMRLSTNINAGFLFKNVKSGEFTITVRGIGYETYSRQYVYSKNTPKMILEPIVLKYSTTALNEVVINGTPSIIYKQDTVEYRASDYAVKPNATLDELVKKMDGVEVGKDGSVTHQGLAIAKARINGKDYFGGDVANAIQNLPADIVDKIQMVDDYGDQAARTGIKDVEPERVLNIITRKDRSVGSRLMGNLGAGNDDRYNGRLNLNHSNGNKQVALQTRYSNTVTGIAGSNDGGFGRGSSNNSNAGSGGVSNSLRTAANYSDTWSRKVNVNGSYSFARSNNNSLNSSVTQQFTQGFGSVHIANEGITESNNESHSFNGRLEYEIDRANYLLITPVFSISTNSNTNSSEIFQTGGIKQDRINSSGTNGTAPRYGLTALYTHSFAKEKRNLSAQLSFNNTDNENTRETDNQFKFYDPVSGDFLKDSLVNLLINNGNFSKNYQVRLTYSEPVSPFSRIEFSTRINRRAYDNNQVTNQFINGQFIRSDELSKIFNYSFTEQRFALNYRYQKEKYDLSLGISAVPAILSGTSETLNTTAHRKSFNVIPIARFEYRWSRQKRFNINYDGNPDEPSFNEIQDVPDISNPQNPVIGNPNLNASFRHNIRSSFNNYLPDSRINISVNTRATFTEDKVVRNTIDIDPLRGSRATYFLNTNGDYSFNGNYNISKQLANRKYRIGINGAIDFLNNISMNNHLRNIAETWTFNQRLNLQLEPTESFEVTPNIRYSFAQTAFSLPISKDSRTTNWALSVEGRADFLKSFIFGYDASKNFMRGINANLSNNPLIINSFLAKEFSNRKATLRLQIYDILNQNNFVIRQIGDDSITDVKSNALSRYFMLTFSMRLQKWSGPPQRHGRPQMRRGDGSYF